MAKHAKDYVGTKTPRDGGTRCVEGRCGRTAVAACAQPLTGRKEGTTCGRGVCLDHGARERPILCPAHRRRSSR